MNYYDPYCRHIAREIAIIRRYFAINSRVLEKHGLPSIEIIHVLIRARDVNRLFYNSWKRLSSVLIRSIKNSPNHGTSVQKEKKGVGAAAFADNPRSVIILPLAERERERMREWKGNRWCGWMEGPAEGPKRESERKVERYIKLSRLYEAGMEMNTPRHARVVSHTHLSVRDTIKPAVSP